MSLIGTFFEGSDSRQLTVRHEAVALQSGGFRKVGCLIATSLAQGGSGFPFLYRGRGLDYTVIPYNEVRDLMNRLSRATVDAKSS